MKRAIALVLMLCLAIINGISVFAEMVPGYYIREDGTIYYDIDNYNRNLEKEQNMNDSMLLSRSNTAPYVSITRFEQITDYYCGPASAYMTIRALGKTVSSSTKSLYFFNSCKNGNCSHGCPINYTDPQVTLGTYIRTSSDNGSDIDRVRMAINNYIEETYYADYHITNNSAGITDFRNKVSSTLEDDHPVVVWVDSRDLNHYAGASGGNGHFICIYSININTGNVNISDCNWTDYGGNYVATISDVVDAMHRSNGANNLIW